jgi:hypothetical protein
MSSSRASAHTAPCSAPSKNDAATSKLTPIMVPQARPITDWRSPGSSRLASKNSAICAQRTTA